MRAINLFTISRLDDEELLPLYEKNLSLRERTCAVRDTEISAIRNLTEGILSETGREAMALLDGWYYSFTIPHISKEFDLLKFDGQKTVVNIELKSQIIDRERILTQLRQNRYYLKSIAPEIYNFLHIKDDEGHYELFIYDPDDENEPLKRCSVGRLADTIRRVRRPVTDDIENYFQAKQFLISPMNTPERFLKGGYFLTSQQRDIKDNILSLKDTGKKFFGISGPAGTGKTLLLYDIVKELSESLSTCIVHSAEVPDGLKVLDRGLPDFHIIDEASAASENLEQYDVIAVDEAHRLGSESFDHIVRASENVKVCLFSYDYEQVLSRSERDRNIPAKIRCLPGFEETSLSGRIRTNEGIFSFIRRMMKNTNKSPHNNPTYYDDVDIVYADSIEESDKIIDLYLSKGYTFIAYSPSIKADGAIEHYGEDRRILKSHDVIGQEFDKVVVFLDDNFMYDADGSLTAKEPQTPDYLYEKLFFQNITRVREKLCIVVIHNKPILEELLWIKANESMEDLERR